VWLKIRLLVRLARIGLVYFAVNARDISTTHPLFW
jgi:hypothetical protein